MGEPAAGTMVDTSSSAFARRLGNLLIATRERRDVSPRQLVRASCGRFSRFDLKALEAGTLELDDEIIDAAVGLYQADISAIMPLRLPVVVSRGLLTAGGVSTAFAPDDSLSLLRSYLLLVRSMRRQKSAPAVDLRREDVESIAAYLGESGESVVMRLGALMGATRAQRSAMASLFASGAVVIGLVGSVAASAPAETGTGSMGGTAAPISTQYDGAVVAPVVSPAETDDSNAADGVGTNGDTQAVVWSPVEIDTSPRTEESAEQPVAADGSAGATVNLDPVDGPADPPTDSTDDDVAGEDGDDTTDDDTLVFTPASIPITIVLEPVVVGVGEPPVPTTVADAVVDTGLPPLPSS
jgi:hypothetical protein